GLGELGAQPSETVGADELEHRRSVGLRVRLGAYRLRQRWVHERGIQTGGLEGADRGHPDARWFRIVLAGLVWRRGRGGRELAPDRARAQAACRRGVADREGGPGWLVDRSHRSSSCASVSFTRASRNGYLAVLPTVIDHFPAVVTDTERAARG